MEKESMWDKATEDPNFVSLQADKVKKLTMTNWRFEQRPEDAKLGPGEYEFKADILEEDDKEVPIKDEGPKQLTTMSQRLKKKLRPLLEDKDPNGTVTLNITKVGEAFATQYLVTEEGKAKEEKVGEQ